MRYISTLPCLSVLALGLTFGCRSQDSHAPVPSRTLEVQEQPVESEQEPPVDPDAFEASFRERFGPREPIYFSVGNEARTNAKLQFSFQYRFANPEGTLAKESGFFDGLFFGYTQTSIWNLESESAPFEDTNYRPSLFWAAEDFWSDEHHQLGLEIGVEHESNGEREPASRSLNAYYIKPRLRIDLSEEWAFLVEPKIYGYMGDLSDNPDIYQYRGYADLTLKLRDIDGWQLGTTLRRGTKKHQGSVQVDLSYPLEKIFGRGFQTYFHAQYFNGYGDSLITYDLKNEAQFRFGFALVR